MTTFYADSSVLVKRHVPEKGSMWVEEQFASPNQNVVFSSQVSNVEVVSALNRRVREGSITVGDYLRLRDDFLSLCDQQYHMLQVTTTVMEQARRLLESHPLRAFDALHLSSALIVNDRLRSQGVPSLVFLAADDRLLAAAIAEGLSVDNPNKH